MLLRLSLGIAILAGLAALYFGHFNVQEKINTLTTSLQTAEANEQAAREAESNARKEANKAKTDLATTTKELNDTKASLEGVSSRLQQQEQRANDLSEKLTQMTGERNTAQAELVAWRALGLTVDQVRTQRDRLLQVEVEKDVVANENKILNRTVQTLRSELARYTDEQEVKLPPGLKGKVVAVDPKFDFVVLDIGGNQGVLENGKMLINRDGKLVAKVRITKVEPNQSVANIMPEWKQDEVMEGDQALY
ncbi:MAG: hypothetical protein AB1813_18915 [Verrucomicrobiota bacterium]|jgi:myosin heavy subunit